MLDIAGTSQTLMFTMSNPTLASQGVNVSLSTMKSSWNVMIEGAWTLIQPYIQQLFPTRLETGNYVTKRLIQLMLDHHERSAHVWVGTHHPTKPMYVGYTKVIPDVGPEMVPLFAPITRAGRPIPVPGADITSAVAADMLDIEIGSFSFEPVPAYTLSKVIPYIVG